MPPHKSVRTQVIGSASRLCCGSVLPAMSPFGVQDSRRTTRVSGIRCVTLATFDLGIRYFDGARFPPDDRSTIVHF